MWRIENWERNWRSSEVEQPSDTVRAMMRLLVYFVVEVVQTLAGSYGAFAWRNHYMTPWFTGKAKRRQPWKGNPLHLIFYGMNFCKCFIASLHQLREQCMGFLFCALKKSMKEALKALGRTTANYKKHLYNMEKLKTFFPTSAKEQMQNHTELS